MIHDWMHVQLQLTRHTLLIDSTFTMYVFSFFHILEFIHVKFGNVIQPTPSSYNVIPHPPNTLLPHTHHTTSSQIPQTHSFPPSLLRVYRMSASPLTVSYSEMRQNIRFSSHRNMHNIGFEIFSL
jgi:hypothetical protein